MTRFRQYEQTAAQWTAQNPVLLKGELGWESGDEPKAKKGDGVTVWAALPYAIQPPLPFPDISGKANLDSPNFTGNPTAPTPSAGDNDTSVATTGFVATAIANKDLPWINLMDEGVVANNIADDTAAYNAAITKAKAANRLLWLPPGKTGLRLTSTVDARYTDGIYDSPIRIAQTTGPGVIFGGNAAQAGTRTLKLTTVTNTTASPANPSVRFIGMKAADATLGNIDYLQFYADGAVPADASIAYCSFTMTGGIITRLEFLGVNGVGWVNDNKFFGGRLKQIDIGGSYTHNGNKFYGPTIESAAISITNGSDNQFLQVRLEGTSTIYFGVSTWANIVESAYLSNNAVFGTNSTVTDLGVNNIVASHLATRMTPVEIARIDRLTRIFDGSMEYNKVSSPVPGLRSLKIRNTNDMFDSGIVEIEQNPEATLVPKDEVYTRINRFQIACSHKVMRPRVYCYDANMTLLDPTGQTYISLVGGWAATASQYYSFGSVVSQARVLVLDPVVKYMRIVIASSSAAGTAFDWIELTTWVKDGNVDSLAQAWHRSSARPLYQATSPVEGVGFLGERVGSATGQFTCVSRIDTATTAAAAGAATTVVVGNITGMASSDIIGILLTDGTTHWTKISGTPTALTITLLVALPAAGAASGAPVSTCRWV